MTGMISDRKACWQTDTLTEWHIDRRIERQLRCDTLIDRHTDTDTMNYRHTDKQRDALTRTH